MGSLDRKISSAAAHVLSKPLGKAKAGKFALVEGITLNTYSKTIAASALNQTPGDARRAAIIESFKKKK